MGIVSETKEELMIESILTMAKDQDTRVSASTNVKLNNLIFSVYEYVLDPLKQVEDLVNENTDFQRTMERNEFDRRYLNKKRIILWVIFIAIYIIFFRLFLDVEQRHIELTLLEQIIETLYISAIFSLVFAIIPIIFQIRYSVLKRKNKKFKEYVEIKSEQNKNKIDDIINQYSKELALIPKEYRTYDAVSYFVKSYQSSKVDCVKEAVNSYDQYAAQRRTQTALNDVVDLLRIINSPSWL